jgi:integrase
MREPWWRKQNGHWYLEVNGKQVRISDEPDPDGGERKNPPVAVQNKWHKFMREGSPEDMQLDDLIALFIDSLPEGDNRTTTRRQLSRFERFAGREVRVSKLRPLTVTNYLKKYPHWKPSSVRTFVNRLHAAINWGVRQGLLDKNPISSTPGYHREGRYERRRGTISAADRITAEREAAPEFRALLIALRETGARPSELARARVEKVFLAEGYMLVPNKTAHKTGEAERKIFLSPLMLELVKDRIGDRTEGHVWLNSLGKAWNVQSMKKRWESLRAKTGVKGSLRSYRRTFIFSAINASNVNPAIVASLVGHVGLEILMKHYYEQDPKAMLDAVAKITSSQPESKP